MLIKENNPWVGLASYKRQDAARFFGREKETRNLSELIQANYCTILYGQSGAGKTSLIQAGVCPLLSDMQFLPIPIKLDHSGTVSYARQIMDRVREEIRGIDGEIEFPIEIPEGVDDRSRAWLFFHTANFWNGQNYRITPALFIDQFEELFNLTSDLLEVQAFFDLVDELLQMVPPERVSEYFERNNIRLPYREKPAFRLLLSLREDFLARLEDYSYSIPALRRNRVGLASMNGQQALDVIMNPMPGLVERDAALRILSKVTAQEVHDDPYYLEKLPVDSCILSLFCTEIYNLAAESGKDGITQDIIDQFGGNIIQTFYERNMEGISTASARYLESHLLTTNGFRNTVALEDLVPDHVKMDELHRLEENRIVRIETMNGTQRVEFTHDVLCKVATNHRKAGNAKKERRRIMLRRIAYVLEVLLNFAILAIFLHGKAGVFFRKSPWGWAVILILFAVCFLLRTGHHSRAHKSPLIMTASAAWGWYLFSRAFEGIPHMDGNLVILLMIYVLSGTVYPFIEFSLQRRSKNGPFLLNCLYPENDRDRWGAILSFFSLSFLSGAAYSHRVMSETVSALLLLLLPLLLIGIYRFLFPHRFGKRFYWVHVLLAEGGILLLTVSQYAHTRVWYFLSLLLLTAVTLSLCIRIPGYKAIWRTLIGIAASAFFFFYAPSYILGYSPVSMKNLARTAHGTVAVEGVPEMMKFNDSQGRQGVFRPENKEWILPVKYDDIRPYARESTIYCPSISGRDGFTFRDLVFFIKDKGADSFKKANLSSIYRMMDPQFTNLLRKEMENGYLAMARGADSLVNLRGDSEPAGKDSTDTSSEPDYMNYQLWSNFAKCFDPDVLFFLAAGSRSGESGESAKKAIIYTCAVGLTRQFLNEDNWKNDKEDCLRTLLYSLYYLRTNTISSSFKEGFNRYLTEEGEKYLGDIDRLILHDTDEALNAIQEDSELRKYALLEFDREENREMWFKMLTMNRPETEGAITRMMEDASLIRQSYYHLFMRHPEICEQLSRQAMLESYSTPLRATAASNLVPALFLNGHAEECKGILDEYAFVRTYDGYIFIDALYRDLRAFCRFGLLDEDSGQYKDYLHILQSKYDDVFQNMTVSRLPRDDRFASVTVYFKGKDVSHSTHTEIHDAILFASPETAIDCDVVRFYGYEKDPFIMIEKGGKKGFVNREGREIYPVRADHAWMFNEGRAFVETGNQLQVIDTTGRPAFEKSFEDPRDYAGRDFVAIDFVYHDGLATMIDKSGHMGLIDTLGNWVLDPVYDYVTNPDEAGVRRLVSGQEKVSLTAAEAAGLRPLR